MWAFRAADQMVALHICGLSCETLFAKYAPHEACVDYVPYLTHSHSCDSTCSLSLSLFICVSRCLPSECLLSDRLPFNRIDRCQLIAQWNPSDYNDNYAAYDFLTRSLAPLPAGQDQKARSVDKCLYTHQHTHKHTHTRSWSCVCARVDPFCKCLCLLQAHSRSDSLADSIQEARRPGGQKAHCQASEFLGKLRSYSFA